MPITSTNMYDNLLERFLEYVNLSEQMFYIVKSPNYVILRLKAFHMRLSNTAVSRANVHLLSEHTRVQNLVFSDECTRTKHHNIHFILS